MAKLHIPALGTELWFGDVRCIDHPEGGHFLLSAHQVAPPCQARTSQVVHDFVTDEFIRAERSSNGFASGTSSELTQKNGLAKGGALKGEGPKFRAFFSPITILALFVSLWVSSRGIWVVFETPGPETCAFGVLGLSCETGGPKAAGVSHDNQRAQT